MDRVPPVDEEEGALELPLDAPRTASTGTQLESLTLEIPAPSAPDPIARWAAALGALLYRYNGQASIPLAASRVSATGAITWCGPLRFACGADVTASDLERQAVLALGAPGRTTVAGRAAITLVEGPSRRPLEIATATAPRADLHLVVYAGGAALVYNALVLGPQTIARSAAHLGRLLAGIATRPDAPLSTLPLLTPEEAARLVAFGEGGRHPLPSEPLHRVIARHAATSPAAIAARHRDRHLTYAELDRRSSQLAHLLIGRGLGTGRYVVVSIEPSLDIAVAVLGIWKAGAIYVPLEPTYPPARIAAILEDTRPQLVLTQTHLIDKLGLGAYPTFAFDRDGAALEPLPDLAPDLATDPRQLAYVYYTSGTTGRPKGVLASHANLITYIQVAQARYEWSSRDVSPAIARFSFSISMFELMSPLVAGGTLVVLDRDHVLDLPRMAKTLSEVTFFHAGPSLLRGLLAHIERSYDDLGAFDGVRHASSGGDLIAPEILEALKRVFRRAEVFVIYGCSEISCMGCTYPVPRERTIDRTYVGRPFTNTAVRVLDRARNVVPIGVAGEICFSGDGVVTGYLDRPELTAEKFVEIDGRRYYTTGDIGRFSEDGWLEILGRNDFQIKVRGMRIELGEVEHALRRAPAVRDGVVVARPGPTGETMLVAYVVLDGAVEETPATAAIRRYLTEQLPDYMVPPTYVVLAAMPLNHNMKLDRRALPDPPRADRRDEAPLRAPETESERALASLWTKLLDVAHVGLDDNFFQLGADSLLATRLVADAQRVLGVALDGMDVLREPLEVLAAVCDRALGRPANVRAPRTSASARVRVTPFFFGAAGELYGVLHEPTGERRDEAVLVCAPLGQERVRTHFVFASLGHQLAARGIPMMQLDYLGTWDSLGETTDGTCERWQRDIAEARAELVRRTGVASVAGLGARFGATLMCAAQVHHGIGFSRVVLWDPVLDGAQLYEEMSSLHRTYLAAMQHLRLGRPPRRYAGAEELLGTTYSTVALRELRALRIAPGTDALGCLVTSQPGRQRDELERLGIARRIEALDFDSGWLDLGQQEDILPDAGITRSLMDLLGERP